jgi:hypothetical protein
MMPTTSNDHHADALGQWSGRNHSAGKAKAKVAPIWLPVAVTSGGKLGMCFLVKLADSA